MAVAVFGMAIGGTSIATTHAAQKPKASSHKLSLKFFEAGAKAAEHSFPTHFEGPKKAVKAPKNIKIAVISCNSALSGCESPVIGAEHAAKALGWQVQTYDGGGNPQTQNKDMLNAISWGANVILNVAIDPNLVQQGLQAAKAHGVIVGSGSNGIDAPNPIVKPAKGKLTYAFDVSPNYIALGKGLADWFIVNSKGKGNLAFFSDPEFPSVKAIEQGFLSEVKKFHGIKVSAPINFTSTQVGTPLAQMTVGYLRAHPSVNWVWSPEDPAAAVQVSAIQQAGMASKVKLMSQVGSQQNINFIRSGQVQVADAAYDNEYMGWAMVDQSIRLLDKKPLATPHNENDPYIVITKSNLPPAGADWHAPFNYQAAFKRLWK